MSEALYLQDFQHDPIVYFENDDGVAVSQTKDRVLVFFRENKERRFLEYKIEDLRSVETVIPGHEKIEVILGQGAGISGALQNAGFSAGTGIRNVLAKQKAKKGTGIRLNLRSMERPVHFIQVSDQENMAKLFEGLSQVLEGSELNGSISNIPYFIRDHYQKLSEGEEKAAAAREERQKKAFQNLFSHPVTLAALAVGSAILANRVHRHITGSGGFERAFEEDVFLFYISCALAVLLGGLSAWRWHSERKKR